MVRVLVIEDDENVRNALAAVLSKKRYWDKEASSGSAGADLYTTSRFDLVITDIAMQPEDAFKIIQDIRHKDRNVKIIATTAHITWRAEDIAQKTEQAGADRILTKPSQMTDLLSTVRKLL